MHLGRFFRQRSRKISFDELSEKLDPRLLPPAAANGCCGSAKGHSPAPAGTGKMRRFRPFARSPADAVFRQLAGTSAAGFGGRRGWIGGEKSNLTIVCGCRVRAV
jgi:hypothetical protein